MAIKGMLMVISGPSGSGKGEAVKLVLKKCDYLNVSVSATTRKIRDTEKEGVNYYFISREEFERRIEHGEMFEYNPYQGELYGTPRKELLEALESGKNIILEIDVNGALNAKRQIPEAVLVFVVPPDFKTLEKRLRGRGDKVEEEKILGRLARSHEELAQLDKYDYLVINEDGELEKTADTIVSIADAELHRASLKPDFAEKFYAN